MDLPLNTIKESLKLAKYKGYYFTPLRDFDNNKENKFMNSMLYIDDSLGQRQEDKCMCQYVSMQIPRLYLLNHLFYWYHNIGIISRFG